MRPSYSRTQSMWELRNPPFLTGKQIAKERETIEKLRQVQTLPSKKITSPTSRRKARKSAESLVREAATIERTQQGQSELLKIIEDFDKRQILKNTNELRVLAEGWEERYTLEEALEEGFHEENLKPLAKWAAEQKTELWTEESWQMIIRHKRGLEFSKAVMNLERRSNIRTGSYLREDCLPRSLLGKWMTTLKKPPLVSNREKTKRVRAEEILLQCFEHILQIRGNLLELLRYSGRGILRRVFLTYLFHFYYGPFISEIENVQMSKFVVLWLSRPDEKNKIMLYLDKSKDVGAKLNEVTIHLSYRQK